MSLESVFKLSLIMNMIDNLTGPMARVTTTTGTSISKLDELSQTFSNTAKAGAAMAGIGAQITDAALSPVKATFATKEALGELKSVGIEDLAALEKASESFSNTWAGTSKAEFIESAYDIKSAIASLSDDAVAKYTEIAGITAKGTKASIGEMTSLFATGYGIYKGYYKDMSDIDFGEMFAAGIAHAANIYKTDGPEMARSISALGAAATSAQVPMEEQFAILGQLQTTMSGSEAGTKYRAFLQSAAKAGEALGLKFTDANNQLLSMPEILSKLKGKFGETMDAAEKMKLTQAFGTDEAVSLVDLLYSKTNDLQSGILGIYDSMGKGTSEVLDMANAINSTEPDQFEVLQQRLHNIGETIGNTLLPTVNQFLSKGEEILTKTASWVQNNQELVKVIMLIVLGFGSFLTVAGSTIAVTSGMGLVFTKTFKSIKDIYKVVRNLPDTITTVRLYGMFAMDAIKKVGGALPGLISTIGRFGAALLTSPVTWIIVGIVALIAVIILLHKHWSTVTTFLKSAGSACANAIMAGLDWIKSGFQGIVTWITGKIAWFGESGKRLVTTFVNGIKSVASKPVDAVKSIFSKIGNLFPHSDAKEGPLSTLTLSGRKTMTTYAQGVTLAQTAPAQAISKGLGKAKVALDRESVQKIQLSRDKDEDSDTDDSKSGASGGKRVIIQKLLMPVDLKQIKDLKQLLKLLAEIEDYTNGNGGDSDDLSPEPA